MKYYSPLNAFCVSIVVSIFLYTVRELFIEDLSIQEHRDSIKQKDLYTKNTLLTKEDIKRCDPRGVLRSCVEVLGISLNEDYTSFTLITVLNPKRGNVLNCITPTHNIMDQIASTLYNFGCTFPLAYISWEHYELDKKNTKLTIVRTKEDGDIHIYDNFHVLYERESN